MRFQDHRAPDAQDFEAMVDAAIANLPDAFRQEARRVAVEIADLAPDTILASLDLDDPFDLTGLYEGIPLTEKSVMDQPHGPDKIWLFRLPILDEWIARGDVKLAALVTNVYVHELAHHFGWSDDDIAEIDQWWT